MSLKKKVLFYAFISSIAVIILYTLITFFILTNLLEQETYSEYKRIVNFYTYGREFKLAKDEFAKNDFQAFKELSLFIKKVNNFDVIFIYDIKALKKVLRNFEGFLKDKEIFNNYLVEGDLQKNYHLIEVIIKTDTYKIHGNLLNPIFIYTYPIMISGSIVGKVAFIERFFFDIKLVISIYLFLVIFTLVNAYLPIRFASRLIKELENLNRLAHSFSNKDFSKIDELRKNIRSSKEKNELYHLKVSLLKMVETLEKYIRHLETEVKSYENLAYTDSLTGLYNRRMFLELAQKIFSEAKRYKEPLSIIMLDIDHFKKINDTYGHDVGDLALKFLTEILRKNVRSSDTVARWGGEEFIILLPKTTMKDAYRVAEKIRKIVEMSSISLPNGEDLSFTVSLGVSTFSGKEDLEELIKEADIALYEAKKKGRNRTEIYTPSLSL